MGLTALILFTCVTYMPWPQVAKCNMSTNKQKQFRLPDAAASSSSPGQVGYDLCILMR